MNHERKNKIHELKMWPPFFEEVARGTKKFEFRKYDRDYGVVDVLVLNEWDPMKSDYTGRMMKVQVLAITICASGWCCMSIDLISASGFSLMRLRK